MICFKVLIEKILNLFCNVRFYISLIIGIIIFLNNSFDLYDLSISTNTSIGIFDGFIYCSANELVATLMFFCMIILFADIPFDNESTTYLLFRIQREKYIIANIMYIIFSILFYYIICFISTIIYLSIKLISVDNFRNLHYTYTNSILQKIKLDIVKFMSPLEISFHSIILTSFYTLFIVLVLLYLNYNMPKYQAIIIVLLFHLSYLMLGDFKMLHPLYHSLISSYRVNEFGESNLLNSYIYLSSLILSMYMVIKESTQNYDFKFAKDYI